MGAWWRSPKHVIPILWFSAGVIAGAVSYYQKLNPATDASFFYTLSLATFTALTGAGIALWVYSSISREGQDREFKHDLEVRHFEAIYGPIYEDTTKVVESLRDYGAPWLDKWRDIKGSSYGPFVDREIFEGMNSLNAELNQLQEVVRAGRLAARDAIRTVVLRRERVHTLEAGIQNGVVDQLYSDYRFVFNPTFESPREDNVLALHQLLPGASTEELGSMIAEVKSALGREDAVVNFVSTRNQVLPRAEALHSKILQRMRHPFQTE